MGFFFLLNCFYSFRTTNKLRSEEIKYKNCDHCDVKNPEESNKIFRHKKDLKSIKTPLIIYIGTESLLEKMHAFRNNQEK